MSSRVFRLLCGWVIIAGSLTGEGIARHVLWMFVTGMALAAICPLGLTAWKAIREISGE